jgi:hypothetical protein
VNPPRSCLPRFHAATQAEFQRGRTDFYSLPAVSKLTTAPALCAHPCQWQKKKKKKARHARGNGPSHCRCRPWTARGWPSSRTPRTAAGAGWLTGSSSSSSRAPTRRRQQQRQRRRRRRRGRAAAAAEVDADAPSRVCCAYRMLRQWDRLVASAKKGLPGYRRCW